MTGPHWAGPYGSAHSATGTKLVWDPLSNRRPPRQAVRFVVRWRVEGFTNPRKRTFTDATKAGGWARAIEAARLLRLPSDAAGCPVGDAASAPFSQVPGARAPRGGDAAIKGGVAAGHLDAAVSLPNGGEEDPPFVGRGDDAVSGTLDGHPTRGARP